MADQSAKTPKLISQMEAAERLGLLDPRNTDRDWKRTILSMIRAGHLDGRIIGRTKMVVENELSRLLRDDPILYTMRKVCLDHGVDNLLALKSAIVVLAAQREQLLAIIERRERMAPAPIVIVSPEPEK